jgi:hypothetical protein
MRTKHKSVTEQIQYNKAIVRYLQQLFLTNHETWVMFTAYTSQLKFHPWYGCLASPGLKEQGPKHSVQIIVITYFGNALYHVDGLFMQFRERVTDLLLRHARFSLLLSGELGTVVCVSISTFSLFESIGLLTLSKHLSLSGISQFRIFISCLRSVDGWRE